MPSSRARKPGDPAAHVHRGDEAGPVCQEVEPLRETRTPPRGWVLKRHFGTKLQGVSLGSIRKGPTQDAGEPRELGSFGTRICRSRADFRPRTQGGAESFSCFSKNRYRLIYYTHRPLPFQLEPALFPKENHPLISENGLPFAQRPRQVDRLRRGCRLRLSSLSWPARQQAGQAMTLFLGWGKAGPSEGGGWQERAPGHGRASAIVGQVLKRECGSVDATPRGRAEAGRFARDGAR